MHHPHLYAIDMWPLHVPLCLSFGDLWFSVIKTVTSWTFLRVTSCPWRYMTNTNQGLRYITEVSKQRICLFSSSLFSATIWSQSLFMGTCFSFTRPKASAGRISSFSLLNLSLIRWIIYLLICQDFEKHWKQQITYWNLVTLVAQTPELEMYFRAENVTLKSNYRSWIKTHKIHNSPYSKRWKIQKHWSLTLCQSLSRNITLNQFPKLAFSVSHLLRPKPKF